jgi:CcmD family protein
MLNFFENNSIYVVLLIVLIIWTGISLFLFISERKLNRIEKKLDEMIEEKNE